MFQVCTGYLKLLDKNWNAKQSFCKVGHNWHYSLTVKNAWCSNTGATYARGQIYEDVVDMNVMQQHTGRAHISSTTNCRFCWNVTSNSFFFNVTDLLFLHVTKIHTRLSIILEITVKFEDLTAVLMNILVLWDTMLCRLMHWCIGYPEDADGKLPQNAGTYTKCYTKVRGIWIPRATGCGMACRR
jgi:hypothetical protein